MSIEVKSKIRNPECKHQNYQIAKKEVKRMEEKMGFKNSFVGNLALKMAQHLISNK